MDFLILGALWVIYSFLEGVREGYANHQKSLSGFNKREKNLTVVFAERILVLLLISYPLLGSGIWSYLVFLIGVLPIFVYVQNSTYFLTRSKLSPGVSHLKERSERPDLYLNRYLRSRLAYVGILSQSVLWWII